MKIKLLLSAIVFSVLTASLSLFFIDRAEGSVISESEETLRCLGCHSNKDMSKTFENKETLSVFVDINQLKNSVHNILTCSNCHRDFIEEHPQRRFKSKREYTVKASDTCMQCHPDSQIKAKPIHRNVLRREKPEAPVCIDCHGSHQVKRIVGGKAFADENQYCMSCHSHKLTMRFMDKSELSVFVDISHLKGSVHSKLGCSACHFGFSVEHHPQRRFTSSRDYSISASESCRRCHFDKYTKTLDSIHYTILSKGDKRAPVCTDCHGSHTIAQTGKERTVSARRCEKCHTEVYNTYASSIHGNALFNEHNLDVPVCADCHTSHSIKDPRTFDYRAMVPDICGQCHSNKEIMGRYGLSTEVVKTYLQDFHGITLKFYKKQKDVNNIRTSKLIAVCVDCHGIHNITKTTGPYSGVVKERLVKRCQECHPGASADFPDAWISHYEPSLKKSPLVFIINLLYKILIPFMVIGLILQILLHVWRYAVAR
jgi:hypothetical protein